MGVKFDFGPLLRAKLHSHRCSVSPLWAKNLKIGLWVTEIPARCATCNAAGNNESPVDFSERHPVVASSVKHYAKRLQAMFIGRRISWSNSKQSSSDCQAILRGVGLLCLQASIFLLFGIPGDLPKPSSSILRTQRLIKDRIRNSQSSHHRPIVTTNCRSAIITMVPRCDIIQASEASSRLANNLTPWEACWLCNEQF